MIEAAHASCRIPSKSWRMKIKIFCSPITHMDPVILGEPPLQVALLAHYTQPVGHSWLYFLTLSNTPENTTFLTILICRLSELYLLYVLGTCSVLSTALPGYITIGSSQSTTTFFSQHSKRLFLWAFCPNFVPPLFKNLQWLSNSHQEEVKILNSIAWPSTVHPHLLQHLYFKSWTTQ